MHRRFQPPVRGHPSTIISLSPFIRDHIHETHGGIQTSLARLKLPSTIVTRNAIQTRSNTRTFQPYTRSAWSTPSIEAVSMTLRDESLVATPAHSPARLSTLLTHSLTHKPTGTTTPPRSEQVLHLTNSPDNRPTDRPTNQLTDKPTRS